MSGAASIGSDDVCDKYVRDSAHKKCITESGCQVTFISSGNNFPQLKYLSF